ncbi:MAG: HAD family phosphatase [Cytophagales bacterium]|nr:HAD family phosphatase [Cytophagales bacterium]
MKEYKAVLLDFGNVIINIDPELTLKAFAEISGKPIDRIRQKITESQLFRRYETGLFEDEEFREIVRQTIGFPFSEHEVDKAWNSLFLNVPHERINLLLDIRSKYPLYLLSNTNNIHIEYCNRYFQKQFGIKTVASLFDKAFYSYEIGLWKPDEDIYKEVLKDIKMQPEEVLFIDDNELNIASAQSMGFQTIHHNPETRDLTDYFDL